MRASKLRTLWIIFLSAVFTAHTCGKSSLKYLLGITSRKWCTEELQRWSNRLLKLVRVNYKVLNPHKVTPEPGKATIIMCNHASLYDIPLSLKVFPDKPVRMLSKKEIAKIPIMGKGMIAAEFPTIDRENRRQAIKDLEKVKNMLEDGIIMWIAPEGTRSKDGKLGQFKKGAFITAISTKATIIPIGIVGANNILPARSKTFNLNQTTEIHIGQPIDASKYTLHQKDELLNIVHEEMQTLLNTRG